MKEKSHFNKEKNLESFLPKHEEAISFKRSSSELF